MLTQLFHAREPGAHLRVENDASVLEVKWLEAKEMKAELDDTARGRCGFCQAMTCGPTRPLETCRR